MGQEEIVDHLMYDHHYTRDEADRLLRDRDALERAMDRYDDPEEIADALARSDTRLHA